MDPNLLNFLISFGSGLAANLSTESLKAAYQRVFAERPDLEHRIAHPTSGPDIQAALSEVAGMLEVLAGTGAITIDGGIISALRSATFNHQDGSLRIGNTRISAPHLNTGGTGSGTTVISGNTELKSAGTSIQIGHGASIVITGNAGIRQT